MWGLQSGDTECSEQQQLLGGCRESHYYCIAESCTERYHHHVVGSHKKTHHHCRERQRNWHVWRPQGKVTSLPCMEAAGNGNIIVSQGGCREATPLVCIEAAEKGNTTGIVSRPQGVTLAMEEHGISREVLTLHTGISRMRVARARTSRACTMWPCGTCAVLRYTRIPVSGKEEILEDSDDEWKRVEWRGWGRPCMVNEMLVVDVKRGE